MFYKFINKTINKHAPLRCISNHKQKLLAKPWLTAGLRKSIRIKNALFLTSDWDKYKFYRNKIISLTRLSKANYYQSFFDLNIRNVIKALRLSWISSFLNNSHDTWTAIPNYYFDKHGGLLFLLNCNYSVGKLDRKIPLFYRELLDYFQQLRSNYEDPLKREFILWNNKDINIENKSVFWRAWWDKNVLFVQDLLNNQGNYFSPQEFSDKYNIKVNFLQYYQITSAIPAYLKSYASAHMDLGDLNSICENFDFQLSKDITLNLKKTLCKQFYKLFIEEINIEPTAIKSWRKNCPEVADNWLNCIQNIYKITRDNKLRQFYFKLLHRILVTNKELKRFGISDCDKCVMCGENDSIEHAFFECQSFLK